MKHETLVTKQFGSRAQAYLESAVHAAGDDLRLLGEAIAASPDALVLDLGCGAGHASFAVAKHAAQVVAYDLSEEMLNIVKRTAEERSLKNLTVAQGAAEKLSLPSNSMDWVISRYSAHHWHNVPAALREVRRVLKPGGRVLLIDTVGEETPLLDTYLQAIELLRDPSHVRNYSRREWGSMFTDAGFAPTIEQEWPLPLNFAAWVARMRTPLENVTAIQSLWAAAPDEVVRHFEVQSDGSFTLRTGMIAAH